MRFIKDLLCVVLMSDDSDVKFLCADDASLVVVEYYLARKFNEMVADIESEMEMEFTDFWNGLKLDDIK